MLATDRCAAISALTSQLRTDAMASHRAGSIVPSSLEAIRASGVLTATIPEEAGGWGLGISNGRPGDLWRVVRAVARADSSVGHAIQVHNGSIDLLNAMGEPAQCERVYERVLTGSMIGAWGSESYSSKTTTVTEVDGGYLVNGEKAYATNAGIADLAFVYGITEGAADPYADVRMMIMDVNAPGVTLKREWWDGALAMRATASHWVSFENVFVPDADVVGEPGAYVTGNWQVRNLPNFASNFLGVIESILEHGRQAAVKKGKAEEPGVIRRAADLQRAVAVLEGLLERMAVVWAEPDPGEDAYLLANLYRWTAGEELVRAVDHATALGGSATLWDGSELGKVVTDALMYVRHEDNDRLCQTVGKAAMGQAADFGFSGARWLASG